MFKGDMRFMYSKHVFAALKCVQKRTTFGVANTWLIYIDSYKVCATVNL